MDVKAALTKDSEVFRLPSKKANKRLDQTMGKLFSAAEANFKENCYRKCRAREEHGLFRDEYAVFMRGHFPLDEHLPGWKPADGYPPPNFRGALQKAEMHGPDLRLYDVGRQ